MKRQLDVRVELHEPIHHRWECVSGLRMGGGNRENARSLIQKLIGDLADITGLGKDFSRDLNDAFAAFGQGDEVLSVAYKKIKAKLFLKQANLLADTGLRRHQAFGGHRNLEAMLRDFPDITQLLKFHLGSLIEGLTHCK